MYTFNYIIFQSQHKNKIKKKTLQFSALKRGSSKKKKKGKSFVAYGSEALVMSPIWHLSSLNLIFIS